MKILFDQGVPVPLRDALIAHNVSTAFEMGWAQLTNGELLNAAEAAFDLLITTDQSLPFQQNLTGRQLAVLILPTTSWPTIRQHLSDVISAVDSLAAGSVNVLTFSDGF